MEWLQSFAAEFAIAAADPTVWLSIGEGLLFGGVCLLFGIWVGRLRRPVGTGCASRRDPRGGLASGLLVLAAWWAALASGGRTHSLRSLSVSRSRSPWPRAASESHRQLPTPP